MTKCQPYTISKYDSNGSPWDNDFEDHEIEERDIDDSFIDDE